jgi:glycosyltransferase involved in cell wall biosynthesis
VYVANVRLPTEKAHGVQIARMCEALALAGVDVTLLHPTRRQPDVALARVSLVDYYGVRPAFTVRALPNLDVMPLSEVVPATAFVPIGFAQALAWGWVASRAAARLEADVCVTRDVPAAYWLVRRGLPTVLELHALPRRVQAGLLARVLRAPALVAVVALTSHLGADVVRRGVPAERVHVLPDGVDLGAFAGLPDRATCRRRLGLPVDSPIVGYVGRFHTLEAEKGVPELVAAMAALPAGAGGAPLLLCVGGPMHAVPAYVAAARAAGVPADRLRFVDRVPTGDVPCWIRACDVVTIPFPPTRHYAYYASPLKLFEYMAAEVPIVASDLPALRDVLRHDHNALLATPGDPAALARTLGTALADGARSRRVARQARTDVERYSWRRRAGALLDACGLAT